MPYLLATPAQWWSYIRRRRIRILMYHSISEDSGDPISVPPAEFRRQMEHLATTGRRGVTLSAALDLLDSGRANHRTVALTFDDGYEDFLTAAVPIMAEHGFSATQFIVTGHIGGCSAWGSFRKNRPLLDWRQIEAAVEEGFEIGSHAVSHSDLRKMDDSALHDELASSRQALEQRLGMPVRHFAYPGGAYAQREVAAVAQCGYATAVQVGGRWGNGPETDRYRLRREGIGRADTAITFARKVRGFYEPYFAAEMVRAVMKRRKTARHCSGNSAPGVGR